MNQQSISQIDGVRPLTVDEGKLLLNRFGLAPEPCTPDYLQRLQWCFLCDSSFHNLELLAGESPRTAEAAIEAVMAGRGGPCHVQATAFLALLKSLGFESYLAAATVNQLGDHMVVVAKTGGQDFVCDVGNGHPYRIPFPLNETIEINHFGWQFVAKGKGTYLELHRRFDDGTWRQIYKVEARPRAFNDFDAIIENHHDSTAFGPFLCGLRAVLIREDKLITLRDLCLRRYSAVGMRERSVPNLVSAAKVLDRIFRFDQDLIRKALDRLKNQAVNWRTIKPRPVRVAVSLSNTNRPVALRRLLASLVEEINSSDSSQVSPPVIMVIDNSVHHEATRSVIDDFVNRLDVRLTNGGSGMSIAESRRAQVQAIARLVAAEPIDAVWMLDDDMVLAQWTLADNHIRRQHNLRYFDDIAYHYHCHPEISMLIGGVTGDPPIRPEAMLSTQLLDVVANINRFSEMNPDSRYTVPNQEEAFNMADYYYDHSEKGTAHLETPFWWLPRAPKTTVREEALLCLREMLGLFNGKAITRLLVQGDTYESYNPETFLLRGGNAVFLDIDSCLSHTYPAIKIDGDDTRRSDMLGLTLLFREGGTWPAEWRYPLMHIRTVEGNDRVKDKRKGILRSLRTEFFGVLMVRAVTQGSSSLVEIAKERSNRIVDCLLQAAYRLDMSLLTINRVRRGWMGTDSGVSEALDKLEISLMSGREAYLGGSTSNQQAKWRSRIIAELYNKKRIYASEQYVKEVCNSGNGCRQI